MLGPDDEPAVVRALILTQGLKQVVTEVGGHLVVVSQLRGSQGNSLGREGGGWVNRFNK